MKDSKLVYKIQPLEVVVEKVLIWRYEHYLIHWQNIFTVSIPHNPHNDRSYAPAKLLLLIDVQLVADDIS